ncbi:hypothetical protein Sjap_017513 [Stephania japonica]|uniref:Transmembrane protein n=1 Tax=Stephania japonica TaxID=461633 RepID=A0AAP0I6B6_9MAGN
MSSVEVTLKFFFYVASMSAAATYVVVILSTSTPAFGSRSSEFVEGGLDKNFLKGLEEDYMVPKLPYYDQYINVGEAQGGTINCETQSTVKKPRHNQDHPSALVPFVPTDDNVANKGSVNNIASTILETLIQAAFNSPDDREPYAGVEVERMKTTEVAATDMDADVEEKLQCDFNTTHHHDVVALPNVESMVETTEVLEEEEGVDWLLDFPQFEPWIWNSAIGKSMHGIMNLLWFECIYMQCSQGSLCICLISLCNDIDL